MQNELTEEKVGEPMEVTVPEESQEILSEEKVPQEKVIDEKVNEEMEEKEYVFYFDLHKLEGADVFNAFKNAIDKELGYKNIKYTLKQANLNTMQEDDAPKLMTGGASNATFPYNVFENSIDSIRGVGEEQRKSIFDGLFTRHKKTEDVPPIPPTEIAIEDKTEPSIEPKKRGFFNFDFSIINIFKKSEKVDIKPTVVDDTVDYKDGDLEDKAQEEVDDEEQDEEDEDEEEYEEEYEEQDDEDVSKELVESSEIKHENRVNDIINENIITVELTIKCIDKKLCMPILLDIKKTMFMK
jgi:hypothetical protein